MGWAVNPAMPPLGLKTYRDLGVMVDETMLARAAPAEPVKAETATRGPWTSALFDKPNQVRFHLDPPHTLWSSYSKDGGESWSEPRFVAALVDSGAQFKHFSWRKATGRALVLKLEVSTGKAFEVSFQEGDLCRLATQGDLQQAPPGRFVLDSVPPGEKRADRLADSICVGGDVLVRANHPPSGYAVDSSLGLLMGSAVKGQVLHVAQSAAGTLYETRAVMTPKGDYLVMIPDGRHASSPREDANTMIAYRSQDQGKTWSGPVSAFGDEAKHHAALPLVGKDRRLHVFGTQRGAAAQAAKGGKAFGFRSSDDDGKLWSPVELIRFADGKTFGGTGVIQMSESAAGTWFAGFHHARILRGVAEGGQRRWSLAASREDSVYPLDELRVLALQGPEVLAMARTCEGHVFTMRSNDDGETFGTAQATPLAHPDAPPMLFYLSDGKTLIALHHNRAVMRSVHEPIHSDWLKMATPTAEQKAQGDKNRHCLKDWVGRAEIWCALSKDGARTWSESRLLFANALAETLDHANPNYQCSYVDLLVDRGMVHLFVPHRWQRVLHLTFPEEQLSTFLTRAELRQNVSLTHP